MRRTGLSELDYKEVTWMETKLKSNDSVLSVQFTLRNPRRRLG